ncbi:MAG: hypothetical protein IJU35_08245 [Paludibacteraceae bacterium]|nr:hypothetical protein [Paludibacteraceae bacterium]
MDKKNILIITACGVIIAALAIGLALSMSRTKKAEENAKAMEEIAAFEKEEMEEEYEKLAMQYDGYTSTLSNDSLVRLLSEEQQHVRDLLEELRMTKANDAKKITALKKELATVRAVMVQYVHQIDSLSRTNEQLAIENKQVKDNLAQITLQAEQLQQEKEQLTEVVTRAQMLETSGFKVTWLNERGKQTEHYKKIAKLQINFNINKNVSAEPGEKTVYLRLVRPDSEVLGNAGTFTYEGAEVPYTLKSDFEYTGEQEAFVLYYTVNQLLPIGNYRAEFFAEGNMIGEYGFKIEK